ncbi:hypothetical protein GF359_03465 [candidate division WOR-3 bacterium]|uniref:Tetratricopeptide repeat protein n=1 Tax=candidate division WOR-3 bacterium TaxID=2052148 RepID=A0A9D5K8H0_UNCW3|nr:hypothetical protein [candidate division WOR-3 bacterium]MBD3364253.1 hypothetical protein [candidate division WOR-3 bacterium]
MITLLLALVAQQGIDSHIHREYSAEPRYRYHIAYQYPEDIDPDLRQLIEKLLKKPDLSVKPSPTEINFQFAYEAALVNRTCSLLQAGDFYKAETLAADYLIPIENDSIPLPYGGDLRASMLYNHADAVYYTAYHSYGKLRSLPLLRISCDAFSEIPDRYPDTYAAVFAELSYAWCLMELGDNHEAQDIFTDIFFSSSDTDARILSAYGKALTHYYVREWDSAYSWFADDKWFEKNLGIVTDSTRITDELTYSELASELIDRLLTWKAHSAQAGKWYGNTLDIFIHITEAYPEREAAADAYFKIVYYYLLAWEIEKAEHATTGLAERAQNYPEIYQASYLSALEQMYFFYLWRPGDFEKAEKYAEEYYKESGDCEKLEELYYTQAIELRDTSDIDDLKGMIAGIKKYNPKSNYLIEPMTNLAYLQSLKKRWEEARQIALDLLNWHDPRAVQDLTSEMSYLLGRACFETGDIAESLRVLEKWVNTYTRGDYARIDLAPEAYWYLALSYYRQAESQGPDSRIKCYTRCKEVLDELTELMTGYTKPGFYKEKEAEINEIIRECETRIKEH